MSQNILLVGSKSHSAWGLVLREGLEDFGDLEEVAESELSDEFPLGCYDLFVVDAGAVADVVTLVARLRHTRPSTPIVVATMSPTWQRARQLLMVGATDYIRKSMDAATVSTALEKILTKRSQA